MELGGNRFLFWLGQKLKIVGERLVARGRPLKVTSPVLKLANPFTIIISFTVNNTDKYQLVVQGNYAQKYKKFGDDQLDVSESELYEIINRHRKNWFKKQI